MGEARDGNVRFGELPLLEGRKLDGEVFERRALEISMPTGPGYHRLRVFDPDRRIRRRQRRHKPSCDCRSCADAMSRAADATRDGRGGSELQLYGLRSARNWGIGDFTDLTRFLGIAARLGADAVGRNPLHALFPGNPERISPYSPSDRRFLSMLYIDVEAIADFAECEPAKDLLGGADLRLRLDAVRKTALDDYSEVAALKRHALELVFRSFHERHLGGKSPECGERTRRRVPPLSTHGRENA